MNCAETRELFSLSLLGQAATRQSRSLERHLARCPECRQEYDRHAELIRVLQDIAREDSARDSCDAKEPSRSGRRPVFLVLSLGAAVAAAVLLVVLFREGGPLPEKSIQRVAVKDGVPTPGSELPPEDPAPVPDSPGALMARSVERLAVIEQALADVQRLDAPDEKTIELLVRRFEETRSGSVRLDIQDYLGAMVNVREEAARELVEHLDLGSRPLRLNARRNLKDREDPDGTLLFRQLRELEELTSSEAREEVQAIVESRSLRVADLDEDQRERLVESVTAFVQRSYPPAEPEFAGLRLLVDLGVDGTEEIFFSWLASPLERGALSNLLDRLVALMQERQLGWDWPRLIDDLSRRLESLTPDQLGLRIQIATVFVLTREERAMQALLDLGDRRDLSDEEREKLSEVLCRSAPYEWVSTATRDRIERLVIDSLPMDDTGNGLDYLARYGSPEARPHLETGLETDPVRSRGRLIRFHLRLNGEPGDSRHVKELEDSLYSKDTAEVQAALEALQGFEGRPLPRSLAEALNGLLRRHLIDRPADPEHGSLARPADSRIAHRILDLLAGRSEEEETILRDEALAAALDRPEWVLRACAARLLDERDGRSDRFLKVLADPGRPLRMQRMLHLLETMEAGSSEFEEQIDRIAHYIETRGRLLMEDEWDRAALNEVKWLLHDLLGLRDETLEEATTRARQVLAVEAPNNVHRKALLVLAASGTESLRKILPELEGRLLSPSRGLGPEVLSLIEQLREFVDAGGSFAVVDDAELRGVLEATAVTTRLASSIEWNGR